MSPNPTEDLPSHLVSRRETLWSIAEDRLGDGARWRELFALNRGRFQQDGSALIRPEDRLHEGWELLLPLGAAPDRASAGSDSEPPEPPPPEPATSEAGSAGSDSEPPEPPPPEPATSEAGSAPPDPEALLRAAEEADRMWSVAEIERREAIEDLPAQPGEQAPSEPPVVIDLAEASEIAEVGDLPVRAGSLLERLAGAGLLVGGVLWTLDRVRSITERRRLPQARLAPPPTSAAHAELSLRAAGEVDLVLLTDLALKAWACRLEEAGRRPPPVVGVNVAEELSLLFGSPDGSPVDGFVCEDGGYSWMTSLDDLETLDRAAEHCAPLPTLFTLGHTDRSQVLFNAEAADVLAVTGSPPNVRDALLAITLDLATGPWARDVRVVAIGLGEELTRFPGVKIAGKLDEVAADLYASVEHASAACRRHGVRGALEARVLGLPGADWAPTVVIAHGLDPDDDRRLADLAASTPGAGLTVVIGSDVQDAGWQLHVSDDEIILDPVGITLERHRIGREVPTIGELIREATTTVPASVPVATAVSGVVSDPQGVEVRVLGPVEVTGAPGEFERRKALELVVFLALHRRGVDGDALAEALWPDRLASPRTLHAVASLARKALGPGPGGGRLLPHAGSDGRYVLDGAAALDAERFSTLVARADASAPDEAAHHLRSALDLVRGRPFTLPGREYLWVHAEALASAIVAEVADAAHRLACLYLEARDPRGAWWATQQGLLASPGNEQLHRDRMLAADLAGNPAGVEEVVEELCRAVEIDRSEMRDVLHPMTIDLYDRLARRSALRATLTGA